MKKYILDSDIISYLADKKSPYHESVAQKIASLNDDDILAVSILILYEYEYGISNADPEIVAKLENTKVKVLSRLKVIPLSLDGAKIFGQIKKAYKDKMGTLEKKIEKNNIDFMIASSAVSQNAILVSNDKIVSIIKEIYHKFNFENWAQSDT
ncbi:MAG: type II toxin-antitoxin system VapC family toxin [bacterium]